MAPGRLGTGIVYVGVVGLMVRWFQDRRGFASGAAAAGYGMGAIVTTFPTRSSLAAHGVDCDVAALTKPIFAIVGFAAAQGLRAPALNSAADAELMAPDGSRDVAPPTMLQDAVSSG